jgi:hypothetical protein
LRALREELAFPSGVFGPPPRFLDILVVFLFLD